MPTSQMVDVEIIIEFPSRQLVRASTQIPRDWFGMQLMQHMKSSWSPALDGILNYPLRVLVNGSVLLTEYHPLVPDTFVPPLVIHFYTDMPLTKKVLKALRQVVSTQQGV